jgi:hypothetical protein
MMAQQPRAWLATALLWWCLLSATTMVQAFSTGPGGCVGGMAASTGHPVPNPLLTFADLGYSLQVNGTEVSSSTSLVIGTTYELSVRSSMAPFRGALIRVDGSGDLVAGENAATASACTNLGEANVEGVGHTNKIDKTVLSGFYTVTGGSSITVDVTVVQSLATGYSHRRYTLDVAAATAPVPAPVVAKTTAAPVAAKTTEAPVAAKTTKAPVAPMVAPAPAPTTNTTNTTKAPVAQAPTMTNTTKAPTMTNTTKAPVAPAPTTNTTNTTKAPVAAPIPEKCVRRRRQA